MSLSYAGRPAMVRRLALVFALALISLIAVAATARADGSDPFSDGAASSLMSSAKAAAAPPDGFTDEPVWDNLFLPSSIRWAPDGRVFVAQLDGVVNVFDDMQDTTPTTYLDLRQNVFQFQDKGLLGMTLDPDFDNGRPYIYVLYTYDKDPNSATFPRWNDDCPTPPGPDADGCVDQARLSRFGPDGVEHVLVQDWCGQFSSHSIGNLEFGPDGALYASAGDGASFTFADYGQAGNPVNPCGDPPAGVGGTQTPPTAWGGALRAQSFRRPAGQPVSLDGSIIRVDPDTGDAMADNPAASDPNANRRRIIAYGARNPFRFTFRPGTNELWFGDVGWNTWEEINRVPDMSAVRNFGWPCYEGSGKVGAYDTLNLNACESLYSAGTITTPYFAYEHGGNIGNNPGCASGTMSTTGVAFYTGTQFPAEYHNALFAADYAAGCIIVIPEGANGLPDSSQAQVFARNVRSPVDLEQGPDGALYYPDLEEGQIRRIAFPEGNQSPTARAEATPDSGPVPLEVTFDGTASTDPDEDSESLGYTWDLDGDGVFDDATGAIVTHTYTTPGNYTVRLRVTDSGGDSSTVAVPIVAGTPPVPTIDTPTASFTWATGDTIAYSGHAVDGDGNPIPASGLSWQLNIRHCARTDTTQCHTHFGSVAVGVSSGTFIAPDHDYPSHVQLVLTATDSNGMRTSKTLDLQPKTVDLTVTSDPAGAEISAGADTGRTPFTLRFIQNSTTTITAATPQSIGDDPFAFESWSDGGASTHTITVPRTDTTYHATFKATTEREIAGANIVGANVSSATPGRGEAYATTAVLGGAVTKLRAYLDASTVADRFVLGLYADDAGKPGELLVQTQSTDVQPGAWNEVTFAGGPSLRAGAHYWIAILNPAGSSGRLAWRDQAGQGGGAELTSAGDTLTELPATWAIGGTFSDGPLSAYVMGEPVDTSEPAEIAASPTSVGFSAVAGGPAPAQQTVKISNAGGGTLNFSVTDDAPWLSVSPATGAAPRDLGVTVNTTGLAAGTYGATITVTSPDVSGPPTVIPVSLVVSPPQAPGADLAVTPTSLSFNATAGGANPAGKPVAVSNAGGGALAFTVTDDAAWLSATPSSGTAPANVSVSADVSGLAAGTYTGSVRIDGGAAAHSPQLVPVTLVVAPAQSGVEMLAGSSSVGTNTSSQPAGTGEVYRIAAATSAGTAQKLRLYVDASNTATQLTLGLYADLAGTPTTLLGSGTISSVTAGAWNEVTLPVPVAVTAGTPYWFALLNPSSSGGRLAWRDRAVAGGGPERTSANRALAALPSSWATGGTFDDGPVSGYVVGSTGAPAPAEVAVAPSSLSFTGTAGAAGPPSKALAVSNAGGGTLAFSVSKDAAWLSVSPSSGTAPQSVTVSADTAGLAAGTYNGTVTVRDSGSSGSVKTVPVSLTIDPAPPAVVAVTPSSLSFSGTAGAASPAAKSLDVSNAGAGAMSFTVSDDAAWLSVSPTSGTAPQSLSASVNTAGLTAGTYTATVTISAPGATGSPKAVPVTLTLAAPAPPVLDVSPSSLGFSAVAGAANPASKSLAVANTGSGTLSFTASDDASWLSVAPSSGTAPQTLTASVDTTGLAAGTYSATVVVTAAGATGSPKSIPVSLTVDAAPQLSVLPGSLSFGATAGGSSPASKTLALSNAGGGTLSYSVSDNAAWLSVTPASGVVPQTLTAAVDVAGLAAGTYGATITVTGGGGASIPVTLTVAPAQSGVDTLAGSSLVGVNTSSQAPGTGEAYRIEAAAVSGTAQKLRLFVDASSTATQLTLGLYADLGGTPTTLLGSGTISSVTAGAWNEVTLPVPVALTAGTPYWFALLNPSSSGGRLAWRDRAVAGGGPERTSANRALAALPSSWATGGSFGDGPVSGYVVGSTGAPAAAEVAVSPGSLSFSATAGAANPASKALDVSNAGGGSLSFTVSKDAAWLSVSPASGTAPQTLTASVNTAGLAAGTYTATVTITAPGATGSPKSIPVTLTVAAPAPAQLDVSPSSLSFSGVAGASSPASRSLAVANTGAGTMSFTVSDDAAWLSVSPSSGTAPQTLTASADTTGLAAGTYNATVTVTAAGATGSPKGIPITLTVAPAPQLAIAPQSLSLSAAAGATTPVSQPVAVSNAGGGTLAYTASSDSPWLTAAPASGSVPATVTVSANPSGLAAGTYTGAVTVAGTGLTEHPKTIAVTFVVDATAPTGLVGAWGFDETTGAQVNDSSVQGNNGTITQASRTTDGRYGGALAFAGANQWVTVPSSTSLNLTTGMTVESWVKPSAINGSWRTVAMKETSSGLAWALYAGEDHGFASGHATTAAGELYSIGSSALPLNQWSHLAVTYDGSTIRLFVNGVQVSSRPQTGALRTSTLPLRFGGNAVWPEWFRGSLDEIRVYNRALPAGEILTDMSRAVSPVSLLSAKRGTTAKRVTKVLKRGAKPFKVKRFRGKHRHQTKLPKR